MPCRSTYPTDPRAAEQWLALAQRDSSKDRREDVTYAVLRFTEGVHAGKHCVTQDFAGALDALVEKGGGVVRIVVHPQDRYRLFGPAKQWRGVALLSDANVPRSKVLFIGKDPAAENATPWHVEADMRDAYEQVAEMDDPQKALEAHASIVRQQEGLEAVTVHKSVALRSDGTGVVLSQWEET